MKYWPSLLLLTTLCPLPAATGPSLEAVQTVYMLPMSGGLDQFLANRLTKGKRFVVVTDPLTADAVFTDRIGPVLEQRLDDLYPPPPPPPTEAAAKPEAAGKTDTGKKSSDSEIEPPFTHEAAPARISSFNRGKGNVFLIDRATRRVLWSYYKLPRNSRAPELDHTADVIADHLHDDAKRSAKVLPKKP